MQTLVDPGAASGADVVVEPGASGASSITVAAAVECPAPRAEAMQVLAARWAFARDLTGFATYDAGGTDGLESAGYFGAVFDGRHVLFAPQCNSAGRHGVALQYDTARPFDAAASWRARDAGHTDGLVTRGYYGAVCDDQYAYYVPRTDGATHHSRVLRLDRRADFAAPGSWSARDAGPPVSYQGGAFDGRFAYFAPGYHQQSGPSGLVMRYDTRAPFEAGESFAFFDAAAGLGPHCACFDGALYDGRHVYFAPLERDTVMRCQVGAPFGDPASWQCFDLGRVRTPGESRGEAGGSRAPVRSCVGAVFDGRYVYFVPYAHSTVVRCDTEGEFGDPASWEAYDAAGTSGLTCRGYDGAAFDGRHVYFIPFWEGGDASGGFHAHLLRHDTRGGFGDRGSWTAADASVLAPPNPGGFNGGAFDGRFLYMAPWRRDAATTQISAHGQVLRYDTADAAAVFALKFMDCGHNGGLCGAVPGPSFAVNTSRGPLTAWANRVPEPGLHHLAGTYDGHVLRLYVDGVLCGEREGGGAMAASDLPLTIGSFDGGTARLRGAVSSVQVWPAALSPEAIAAWTPPGRTA